MRRDIAILAAFSCLTAPAIAADKSKLPEELVLSGDNVISVMVEGQPFTLEVRPEAAVAPMFNPNVAKALELKPGMFGFRVAVGPQMVNGSSAVHKLDYGAGEQKQRIFWADHASSSVADGTISPASLPYKRVKFILADAVGGEKLHRLSLDNFGFLGQIGIGTTVKVGKEKAQFRFSLERDETLVSAPTGNWLAENLNGKLTGPARSTLIYYGIERPTRSMQLATSIPVGDFQLTAVDVRVSDYGDATGIEEAGATPAGDSEEIIVTGKRDKDVDLRITAGRSFLKGCSSLLYDFDKREVIVSCASATP
jgi:hypothetical protein